MRVKCVLNAGTDLAPFFGRGTLYSQSTAFPVALGHEYSVFGMVLFNGGLSLLVAVEHQPQWLPLELFDVLDPSVPTEWEFGRMPEGIGRSPEGVQALWGYHDLVSNQAHYVGLVERDYEALAIFALVEHSR